MSGKGKIHPTSPRKGGEKMEAIGEKKLRQIASENLDSGFVIQNGVKVLIKRKRFETFLEELSAI